MTVSLGSVRQRLRRLNHFGPARVLHIYWSSHTNDYAASLAFSALLTAFPMLVGFLSLLSLVIRNQALNSEIQSLLVQLFPPGTQQAIQATVRNFGRSAGLLGILSVLALIWYGTGFFARLEFALDSIYISSNRSFWAQRRRGLALIGVLVLAVAADAIVGWTVSLASDVPGLGFITSCVVLSALLTIMYRYVPNRRMSFNESWPGAFVAGVGIQALNLVFPIYEKVTRNLTVLGRGLLLVLLLAIWLYVASQLILIGAIVNRMQMERTPVIGRSHELGGG